MYSMHFRLPEWQRNEAALNKISREYGKEKIMEGDFCMKKFLALLMTVAMVLSLVAVPTLADIPEDEVCFFIDDYTANAGDTITVPVLIYNYEGNAHGLAMHVTYDPSVLEVTNVTRGDWLTNALLEVGATVIIDYTTLAEEGKIAIGMMCPTDPAPAAASPETIINISFTVKADAVPGTYDFGYWFPETAAFFNMPVGATTGTDIPHTDIAGQLTVEGEVPPVSDTGWYFETDPEDEGWYWLDEDGDGNEWQWMLGEGMNVPEGEGMMNSQSFINDFGPLTPDNWLISPVFEAGTQISFMMVGQDPDYAAEYIGVYVSTDGGETWSDEIAGFTATGEVTTYFVDTAAYAGQMICVAFRHYNVTDMFSVNLDAVEVLGRGTVDPTVPPVDPTEPPVDPTEPPVDPTEPPVASDLDEALNVPGGTIHFTSEGAYPWQVVENYAESGNHNVSSSSSSVSCVVTAEEGDIVQFLFQSNGEGSSNFWDKFQFFVDGVEQFAFGAGPHDWTVYATALTAGEHTLTWTYTKDSSVNNEPDCARLDDVYVGQPVEPTEVVVNDLEVPAGRYAMVEYTVLPSEAFDKSVTFAVADTSIATVDANGRVLGVAVGTTTITVTTVNGITGTATINVTEAIPTVNLIGYIAFDPAGASGIWGSFADYDPSTITNLNVAGAVATFCATTVGDTIYGYNYNDSDTRFYTINTETWTLSYPGTSAPAGYIPLGMAYDYTTNTLYAMMADNSSEQVRGLYIVDRATGACQLVANFVDEDGDIMGGDPIMVFAIDNEGTMFGISYYGELYRIDLETAMCYDIGYTGIEMKYVQSATWDMNTNQMFWAHFNDVTNGTLYIVNTETAEITSCGTIGGGAEVLGLCTIYADADIPDPEFGDVTITFVDGVDNSVIDTYTMQAGQAIPDEAFPAAPQHEGWEFTGWDYDGAAVYFDLTVTAQYVDPNAVGWYFETDPEDEGWYWLDEDGDGNEWQWMLGAVEMNIPEGEGMMNSQSFINYVGPLTPDNWLVSPVFEAGTQVSFMMVGQDPAYAAEYIGVYVSVDGGETWSDEIASFTATGEVTTYFVDTAEYAGQMICVAFRHYNVTDMFSVNLDAVEVLGRGTVDPTEPPVDPTEPPVEPTLPPIGELPSFVVDNYYAQVGDVIEIPVVLYAYEGNAHVLNMWLDYDPAALQINSITYGEFITNAQGLGGMVVLDYTTVPGSIRLGVVDPQNDPIPAGSEPMVIYTINATVLEGAAETNVLDITVNEFKNYPIGGTVTLLEHYVYDGAVIIGEEPTEPPVEPTEPPVEPTEPPVEPTPTPAPVPGTGAATLIGLGVMALLSGAGVVLFRKKED